MQKLACLSVFIGATGLMACGGDDDVTIVDSGPVVDAPVESLCNPVTQEGCGEGEKCAQLTVSAGPPFLGRTACVPNGTVAVGGECADGEPGEASGYDNCAAEPGLGGQCINGVCREICTSPEDTCGDDFSCTFFVDLFNDIETEQVGVCNEVCNPVTQDCSIEGEGCYLNPTNREGEATCVGVPEDSVGLTQGEDCHGPNAMSCYLNGCDAGYHPQVRTFTVQPTKAPCVAYCQPVDTYLADPMGTGKGKLVGNAEGFVDPKDPKAPLVNCSADRIGAAAHQCRFFQAIGFADLEFDYIPVEYGFCQDTAAGESLLELWGDCTLNSEERLFRIFDEAGGGKAGQMAIDMFCTKDEAGIAGACAIGCISDAKAQELADAYCKKPPVPKSPFCAELEQRDRFFDYRRERERRAYEALRSQL